MKTAKKVMLIRLQQVTKVEQNNEHISKHSKGYSNGHTGMIKPTQLGEVMTPALACGAVGAVLTIILSLIGMYDGLNQWIKDYYMGEPFYMKESVGWHPLGDWILVILLTFGVSSAVLDTDKQWRRVMIIPLLSVVIIFSSPVLMLWDVFWSPVTVFVGVLWSWICAFIYSCQHTMPCELILQSAVKPAEAAEANQPAEEETEILQKDVSEEISEEKYQPNQPKQPEVKEQTSCPD